MQFGDMINLLGNCHYHVAIRDEDNNHVCTASTESKGVIPYVDNEVIRWFIGGSLANPADFTVMLKGL